MDYLIVYDISDPKKRLKLSRMLQKVGYRIQYSAFFLKDIEEDKIDLIYQEILQLIDKSTDRVFIYPVFEPEVFKGYPLEPWKIFVI